MGRVYDVRLQPPYLQRIGTFGDTTCKEESGERQLRAYVREEIERDRERKGGKEKESVGNLMIIVLDVRDVEVVRRVCVASR